MVAQDALEALGLDLILLVPARVSPFKVGEESTPGELRTRMLEASLAGHPALGVWGGELVRSAPSYTVDTLEQVRAEFPDASIHLLVGQDQWASFSRWRDPRRIMELARVCVLGRGEAGADRDPAEPGDWPHLRIPSRRVDVSSTEVRERVAAGRSIRYMVPEAVRHLIIENRLYGSPGPAGMGPGRPHS